MFLVLLAMLDSMLFGFVGLICHCVISVLLATLSTVLPSVRLLTVGSLAVPLLLSHFCSVAVG